MQFYRFECIGSDEYANIRDRMHSILYSSMVHRGDAFVRAIDAAVDNAARFAADTGCAHISIRLRIMMYSIATTVAAKTRDCCTKKTICLRAARADNSTQNTGLLHETTVQQPQFCAKTQKPVFSNTGFWRKI